MRYFYLLITLFCFNSAFGQWNWPAQVNAFTTGPYYNYLAFYADQNDHLQILVTLTDQNATSVPAKLNIRIEGAGWWVETKPFNNIAPLYLEPFVPNVISGIQLQPYLLESNLNKSDPNLDLNNLPEGYTEVCVEVIGVGGTLTTIGGNQCTPFWLQRFQPSQAIAPQCDSELDTNLMFHTFQWTPPIGYVPSIGSELTYTFSLYEWLDPNNFTIFQTGQGLVYQTTSQMELVQISDFDVQLQNGVQYVWRVQAQLTENGMPVNMFENNGLSEICTFRYGEAQSLAQNLVDGLTIDLQAQANTQYKGAANWTVTDNTPSQGLSTYERYYIEYRLKPDQQHPNPNWHYDTVYSLSKAIYQLAPERTYQVRVSGMAGNFTSDATPIVEFTTPAAVDYACGDQQMPFRPQNYTPNENVIVGNQVQIGQFLMTISEAIPQYSPGRYSGKGLIPIDFLGGARAKVTFDNILIDNEFVVREGRVDVVTDGVDNWLYDELKDHVDPIFVDGTIDSAWVDTTAGVAWITLDGVDTSFVFDPPDYPIVINDASGYTWTIYPNGLVEVSTYLDPSNDHLDVTAADAVYFQQNPGETFGFDAREHQEWYEQYEVIELSDSSFYFVPNKSIGKDVGDLADIQIPSGVSPTFKLNDQISLPSSPSGGGVGGGQSTQLFSVVIPPIPQKGTHTLYAYNQNDERIGKLNIVVYTRKDRKVIVVPVANMNINAQQLETTLQNTLGEANLNIDLTVAPQWNNTEFTTSRTIALPEDMYLMSKYSEAMRSLRDAYFADTSIQKDNNAYYLFVVPGFDDPAVDGYMVKGKALGFVIGTDYNTYAHELGHGMGALDHTWKFNGPSQASTSNLMDYAHGAENLTKAQWKGLRDVDFVPTMWDDVEDGNSITLSISEIPDSFRNADSTFSFFASSGEVITLPVNTSNVTFSTSDPLRYTDNANFTGEGVPIGALSHFSIQENSEEIHFAISIDGGISTYENKSYQNIQSVNVNATGNSNPEIPASNAWEEPVSYWDQYYDTITKTLADAEPILGFAYYEAREIKFQIYPFLVSGVGETENRYFWNVNSNAFFAVDYTRDESDPSVPSYWLSAGDYYSGFFQSIQGTGAKISSGLNVSEISPRAQEYLEEFSEWAGPNTITAPLVIALAHWITEFDAIDNFTDCVIDPMSNVDPLYTWALNEELSDPFSVGSPTAPGTIQSENDPSMASIVNGQEQGLLFEELWDYYHTFEVAQQQIAAGFNTETTINSGLSNATNKTEVDNILSQFYTSNLCNYWLISGQNRLHAIDILKTGNPTDSELQQIIDLTTTAKENGQALQIYNAYFSNNSALFWDVTESMTSGINFSGYNDFVHSLLQLAQLSNPQNLYTDSIGYYPSAIRENLKISHFTHTEFPQSNQLYFEAFTRNSNCIPNPCIETDEMYLAPNDFVRVDLMDFTDAATKQFYQDNGFLGRDMVLPAFYLSYLEYNRRFANGMIAVNGVVDVIAIITAIPTAGTSTVAAVTITLATTNIIVTTNQSSIQNTSWGGEFMAVWDVVQMVDLGNGLFQIAKGITRKLVGGVTQFFLDSQEIIDAMRAQSASLKADGLEAYQIIRNGLTKLQGNANSQAAKLYQYIVQQLDAEYILNFKNTFNDAGYDLNFFNSHNLVISNNGANTNLLTLETNAGGAYLKGNILDDAPTNAQLCSSLDDVRFRKNSSTNIEEGDLDFYKKADGSYVVVNASYETFGIYSTAIDDFVSVIEQEELFGNAASTFLDEIYRTVQTNIGFEVFRTFGADAKIGGTFVTTLSGSSRNQLALLDEWNNSMRFEAKIHIPSGTTLNIGKVGPQSSTDGSQTLAGGADQVIMPFQWNTDWVVEIRDSSTGIIYYSIEEFAEAFPNLVN